MIRPRASKVVSDRDWIVTLDVSADEYYGSEQVKRALVRYYPIKVVRLDIDPSTTPSAWRWTATPAHPSASNAADADPGRAPANASGHLQGDSP